MILLDTNALIRLIDGGPIRSTAREIITKAADAGLLAVSATCAWEIGLLETRTGRSRTIFGGDARRWFHRAVISARLRVLNFDIETAFEATYLPGGMHRDPSDRWIVATARLNDATLITADRRILDYAALGHVRALVC